MSRGGAADRDAVLGAHAWACMRRNPRYRKAWTAHAAPLRFEQADIPIRLQSEADLLVEEGWALLAWEDPGAEVWRSPFWSGVPMLIGEPDPDPGPDPAPLLPLLAEAGAQVEGPRHAHREVDQAHRREPLGVARQRPLVAAHPREAVDVARERRLHDRMDKQVRIAPARGLERQRHMRAVERVAGLEPHHALVLGRPHEPLQRREGAVQQELQVRQPARAQRPAPRVAHETPRPGQRRALRIAVPEGGAMRREPHRRAVSRHARGARHDRRHVRFRRPLHLSRLPAGDRPPPHDRPPCA